MKCGRACGPNHAIGRSRKQRPSARSALSEEQSLTLAQSAGRAPRIVSTFFIVDTSVVVAGLLATRADLVLVTGDKLRLQDQAMQQRIILPQAFVAQMLH